MEFAPSEREPCVRCLQLGFGLCQPDFVGARVDGKEEIALMDDVPILEVYSGKGAADLGAQLNLLAPAHDRIDNPSCNQSTLSLTGCQHRTTTSPSRRPTTYCRHGDPCCPSS